MSLKLFLNVPEQESKKSKIIIDSRLIQSQLILFLNQKTLFCVITFKHSIKKV